MKGPNPVNHTKTFLIRLIRPDEKTGKTKHTSITLPGPKSNNRHDMRARARLYERCTSEFLLSLDLAEFQACFVEFLGSKRWANFIEHIKSALPKDIERIMNHLRSCLDAKPAIVIPHGRITSAEPKVSCSLTPEQKRCSAALDFQEKIPLDEIARRLGEPEATVKFWIGPEVYEAVKKELGASDLSEAHRLLALRIASHQVREKFLRGDADEKAFTQLRLLSVTAKARRTLINDEPPETPSKESKEALDEAQRLYADDEEPKA